METALNKKTKYQLFKHYFPFIHPYKNLVTANVLIITVVSILGMIDPLVIGFIFDEVFSSRDVRLLLITVSLVLLAQLVRKALEFLRDYQNRVLSIRVEHDLRSHIFKYFESLQIKNYGNLSVGEYMFRLDKDAAQIRALVSTSIPEVFKTIVEMTLMISLAFAINWKLAILALCIVPIFIINSIWTFKRFSFFEKNDYERAAELNGFMKENLAAIEEVKINRAEGRQILRYLRLTSRKLRAELEGGIFYNLFSLSTDLPTMLWTSAITGLAGYEVITSQISIGQYVAVTGYLLRIFGPLSRFGFLYKEIIWELMSAERIHELLEFESEKAFDGMESLEGIDKIELFGVKFRYPSQNKEVLKNFNLTINRGEKIAIVGPIGCGKSTIIKLLTRFYAPTEGQIQVNGVQIERLDKNWLRDRIGLVLQKPTIFDDTVYNNIRLGNPKLSDGEIAQRLDEIGLTQYFEEFEDGLNKRAGEEGARLSGGQRQLVAIARAYMKNGDLLVFDEATASLDSFTERSVNDSMEKLMAGRTTIIIAHRLSSILNVDRIVYMTDGHIVEQGTLAELLQKNGYFSDLYKSFYRTDNSLTGPSLNPLRQKSIENGTVTLWSGDESAINEMEFEGKVSVTKKYTEQGEICVDLKGANGYCAERCSSTYLSPKFQRDRLDKFSVDLYLPEKTVMGWGKSMNFHLVAITSEKPWGDIGNFVIKPGWNFLIFDCRKIYDVKKFVFVFSSGAPSNGSVYLTNFKGIFSEGQIEGL
jgi:ABC-type multidrug transport system fused ATPase/permease subunit